MAGVRNSLAAFAPWKLWQSTSVKRPPFMPSHEDLDESRPILYLDITSPLSLSEPTPTQLYGSTHISEGPSIKCSPAARRNSLLRVLEEDQSPEDGLNEEAEDEEWELEKQGLYRGSYTRIVALYTFVPLSSLVAFVSFASLQVFVYPPQLPDTYPYPKNLPFPLPELLTSASLWSLSHLLRIPLHSIFFSLFTSPTPAIILSTLFHVVVHNLLRLAAIPLLHHRMSLAYPIWHDPTFRRIWWVALGWSLAEVTVGIAQGYDQISLYRDVLVPEGREEDLQNWKYDNSHSSPSYFPPTNGTSTESSASTSIGAGYDAKGKSTELPMQTEDIRLTQNNAILAFQNPSHILLQGAPQAQVDRDLDRLMSLRGREELEEVYGIPAIRIPVFISCLLRFNSIVLSLGVMLVISASYLRSQLSQSLTFTSYSHLYVYETHDSSFFIAFPIIIALHLFLALLHTPLILPRIQVHTAAYIGLLVSLGCLFIGLGMWEVLS